MATTLATLRASLQRKTDGQLTVSGDQDTYLVLAEKQVIRDWMRFDKALFRDITRQTATTDANGILLMDANITRLERLEDANKMKYVLIDDVNDRWDKTGYYFAGYDSSNNKRQVQIMKNGSALASTAMYYFSVDLKLMSTGTSTSQTAIPEEYRDAIALKAAQLYFEDQGPPLQSTAEAFEMRYRRIMDEAKRWYRNVAQDPEYIESADPDSGGAGSMVTHIVS